METSPNLSKRRKDVIQSESPITGEAGLADERSSTVANANCGAEPDFNLNLSVASPRNPRMATETSKLYGGNKKDNGNKGGRKHGAKVAVTMETGMSASTLATPVMSVGERDDPPQQKSKIPALSHSPTAEALLSSRSEQRLKSSNFKHTSTLSPKLHTHSIMAASPKPHRVEQTMIASSPRTTEKSRAQVSRAESASISNPKSHTALTTELATKTTTKTTVGLKIQTNRKEEGGKETQTPKTLDLPVSPRVHNQRGDSNIISPKLANRTPTLTAKNPKQDVASTKLNEQTRHDTRDHSSETPNKRAEMALHNNKALQPTSLNPKPSTQKKVSGTRSSQALGSKENLDGKDSSVGSGSKTSSKSSSNCKATALTKGSLAGSDSKVSTNSKTSIGSGDSLDSKCSSPCKTTWGSKDSLDSKTNSKVSPSCKSGMGLRDTLDSKTATETTASKTNSKTVVGSKSEMASKDDPKTSSDFKVSLNLKTSPSFKRASELKLNCNSDALSSSKPGPTHSTSKLSHVTSGSKIGLGGSVSPSSSKTGLSGTKDDNLKNASPSPKQSPDPREGSVSSKPGPVQSGSKSALADLSLSVTLSPRPSSASRSPGSGPGKSLGTGPSRPNREVQKSSGSAPGSGLLAPLTTSSPKTRAAVALTTRGGSTPEPAAGETITVETKPSVTLNNTSLTRGLTFDSITKTSAKAGAADKEELLKLPETKVTAVGGPVLSQGAVRGVDVSDKAGWSPGTLLSKPGHLGDTNAITTDSNITSSKTICVESKEEEKMKQEVTKQEDGLQSSSVSSSSSLHPLFQPSTHSASSKTVRETATMTDPSETLHLRKTDQREVGIQVEVEVVERSASTSSSLHWEAPTSSLIGSSSCQSGGLTSPTVPSVCSIPAGQAPFQHICKIDIEMVSQSVLPSVVTDKASSLPACLRTYSFQKSPALMSELHLGQNQDRDVSAESIWEEEREEKEKGDDKVTREQNEERAGREETEKPQEVAWDKHGMTWEVYGASVDLECLGTAIQSHLESKIREQEKHISTLRKSICSNSSLRGYKKKRKKRRGGILGCFRKAPAVAD